MTIDPKRADLETAVLLLVGKACERALAKEKNRKKGVAVPDLHGCMEALDEEVDEAWHAFNFADREEESLIDELGDVITNAGLALWRAHGGGQ